MELPELKRKRGFAKASLTRIEKISQAGNLTNLAVEELYVHLELLEKAYIEFKDYDEKIAELDETLTEIEEFVPRYTKVKADFRKVVSGRNPMLQAVQTQMNETMTSFTNYQREMLETMKDQSFSVSSNRDENIKLPRLQIPPFDGNSYDEFLTFKNLYDTAVHKNPTITDIHKFQYLKGLLTDKARKQLLHIPLEEKNYEEAYNKLCKRFDKPDQVYKALIQKFMTIPSASNGTAESIRNICDTADEVVRGLKVLGEKAESRDPWLIHILLQKLDDKMQKKWAVKTVDDPYLTFNNFIQFLEKRCTALESADPVPKRKAHKPLSYHSNISSESDDTSTAKAKPARSEGTSSNKREGPPCASCKSQHQLHECDKFRELSTYERKELAATARVCYNCLYKGHSSKTCPSRHRCFVCQRKHHTLLHDYSENQKIAMISTSPAEELRNEAAASMSSSSETKTNVSIYNSIHVRTSLLPTALVRVADKNGNYNLCRILLDSGSTGCLMTESCAQRLQLTRKNLRIPVAGVASQTVSRGCAHIKIIPHFSNDFELEVQVVILSRLTSQLPRISESVIKEWPDIKPLTLADPLKSIHADIDIILGAAQFFRLLRSGCIIGPSDLTAQNTAFGWIISGENSNKLPSNITLQVEFNVDECLRKFWELEEVPTVTRLTLQQQYCDELFKSTHARDDTGRFVVKLPFAAKSQKLGNSLPQATSRFHSIERRLQRDIPLKEAYTKFMDEYLSLNHMEEINDCNLDLDREHFYLPHHPVIKPTNLTTKVRVVFDGSAKTTSAVSLNDKLLVGATVQSDLDEIIMRFRMNKIAFTADIAQMYRQIRVAPEDCNYQRIVWRDDPDSILKHFRLLTVTYGTSAAPYLATRSLHQLSIETQESYPAASKAIKDDFYVDDLITGAQNLSEATHLATQIINILNSAGFRLHKWGSNSPELLHNVTCENSDASLVHLSKDAEHKVLGLHWDAKNDVFRFKVNLTCSPEQLTKRRLLSESSRLFDPLGWLAPAIITIKTLFQQLWILHLEWDDPLPQSISQKWVQIRENLVDLERCQIPRFVETNDTSQIHGFCDASEQAYAAAVYIRSIDCNGIVQIHLIAAKTRVAPIKRLTIPRLELSGAYLLAQLIKHVHKALEIKNPPIHAWTDSEIVLHWLTKLPCKCPVFIGNRTAQIFDMIPTALWGHVRSAENPADCASRGLMPGDLVTHQLWWHGPKWLLEEKEHWPENSIKSFMDGVELPELDNYVCYESELNYPCLFKTLTEQHSSYSRLKRILGYCSKFISNARDAVKNRVSTTEPPRKLKVMHVWLTTQDLKMAETYLCRWSQREEFPEEITILSSGSQITKGKLVSLSPFLDEHRVLRVGGRLTHALISEDQKHQIILSKNHILSKMILTFLHKLYLHPGPSLLSHLSKTRFWITNSRCLMRKVTNLCSLCNRLKCQPSIPMMGDLPKDRVAPSRAFNHTGVDFAGPIQIATKKGRGAKHVKGYIAVFVCLTVKAVHLELVCDLSTESFLGAMRRFVSRRGLPAKMYSDNGTNFVGAKRRLAEMQQQLFRTTTNPEVLAYTTERHIEWQFTPPSSPWFGGLWESAVKIMKHHLVRSTANSRLTQDEIATIVTQIEAIMNSRPLTPTHDDTDDLFALTPAHFLLAHPLLAIPEPSLLHILDNRLSRWQEVKKRIDGFWRRFVKEYLHSLQQRRKWQSQSTENLKVDDVVYIKEEGTPPLSWPLGRITEVHPGKDGITRVVTLKTARTTLKRPVAKLIKIQC